MSLTHIGRTFRERLLPNFSWSVLAALSLQGSVLLSSIVVARLIGLVSFGAYAILVSTVMTIATVAQGGSGLVATKFIGEHLASDPQKVARILHLCRIFTLATSTLTVMLVVAFAEVLSENVLRRPELTTLVRFAAIAIFFQVWASYQHGALQGFGAFRQLSRGSAFAGVAYIAFAVGGALLGNLEGAVIGFALASASRSAVFGLVLRAVRHENLIPHATALRRDEFTMMWRFALPTSLAGFVTMPCLWLVTVLVTRLPDGLALVAILLAANQVRLVTLQFPALLNAVSFSLLSRLKGQRDATGFRNVFWSNLCINFMFAMFIVATLVVYAEPLLRLYGDSFVAGRWALVLLLTSVLFELLAVNFYQLVQSAGRMWHSLFLIALPRDLLYVVVAAIFVSSHGIVAAAVSYLLAHAVGLLTTVLVARRCAPAAVWTSRRDAIAGQPAR